MNDVEVTKLWKEKVSKVLSKDDVNIEKYIFPSARQALAEAMIKAGIQRHDRVAVPEWITNCVVNSMSKVSMIIPLKEVIKYKIPVKAALIYEQWGWTLLPEIKDAIIKSVEAELFILDRVDSADMNNERILNLAPEYSQIELYSLYKVLGTKGGGIAKYNGQYIEFVGDKNEQKVCDFLFNNDITRNIKDKMLHIVKSEFRGRHPELIKFVEKRNCLEYYTFEADERRKNVKAIVDSKLADCWNTWMYKALDIGSAPGIAPLFIDYPEENLIKIKNYVEKEYNIISSIYNFNYSGNPVETDYRKCFAFPVHSDVSDIQNIVYDLEKKFYCK